MKMDQANAELGATKRSKRCIMAASSQGSYWDDERGYKQTMLDRVHEYMGTQPPLSDIELGRRLLATLIDKPSNLLDWRTQGRLAEIRTAHPDVIENASGKLAH